MQIIDYDLNSYQDRFTVETKDGSFSIPFTDFGDFLADAGIVDGFDGENVIFYGTEEPIFNYQTGEMRYIRERDRSEPLRSFVRDTIDDDTLIQYLQSVVEDDLILKNH